MLGDCPPMFMLKLGGKLHLSRDSCGEEVTKVRPAYFSLAFKLIDW